MPKIHGAREYNPRVIDASSYGDGTVNLRIMPDQVSKKVLMQLSLDRGAVASLAEVLRQAIEAAANLPDPLAGAGPAAPSIGRPV